MGLPNQQFPHGSFGNAQPLSLEQEPSMLVVLSESSLLSVPESFIKIKISGIRFFNMFETHDLSLHSHNESVSPGQGIGHHIVFALLVLDHIGKGFHELEPSGVPLLERGLSPQVLKCFMICMNNKLLRQKVMLPSFK